MICFIPNLGQNVCFVIQSSTTAQTLIAPLVVNGSQSWSATGGKLIIGSTSISTGTLTITPSQSFNGGFSILGGTVRKSGTNTLGFFNGNISTSGPFESQAVPSKPATARFHRRAVSLASRFTHLLDD